MSINHSSSMTKTVLMSVVMLTLVPSADAASRGVQFSSDGSLTFVSKDVGAERYAITREENDTLTGNVFFTDGRDPAFIVCNPLGDFTYRCRTAEACDLSACNTLKCGVTGDPVIVNLPTDFFQPPTEETESTTTPPAQIVVSTDRTSQCDSLGTEPAARGKQHTTNGNKILINRDVAGQRYAITKYPNGRVTGNIFLESGEPPRFLDCDSDAGGGLSCRLADPCPAAPLPCTFVNALGNEESVAASLPDGFFNLCPDVLEAVSDVRTSVPSCLRVGTAPIPQPGALTTVGAVRGNTTARAGETNRLGVDYDATAQVSTSAGIAQVKGLRLLVAVAPGTNPENRATGYFELPLDEPAGTIEVSVDITQGARGDYQLLFATSVNDVPSSYRPVRQFVPAIIPPPGEGGQSHGGARAPGTRAAAAGPPQL